MLKRIYKGHDVNQNIKLKYLYKHKSNRMDTTYLGYDRLKNNTK